MRIALVAFTKRGLALAQRLVRAFADVGDEPSLSCPPRIAVPGVTGAYESLSSWTAESFATSDALIFVGAYGIAVRAIAPHVQDKLSDPAVVCIDEAGACAVPLLSGHVGGANELARRVAAVVGGHAAISTATDVNEVFAVDVWAATQGLVMLDRDVAKEVSAALLEGKPVGFASDLAVAGELPVGLVRCFESNSSEEGCPQSVLKASDSSQGVPPEVFACEQGKALGDSLASDARGFACFEEAQTANSNSSSVDGRAHAPELGISISLDASRMPFKRTLRLVPRVITVGVGCKRGTPAAAIVALVDDCLSEAGFASEAVCALASIDVKADEPALHELARAQGWDLHFYSAEELASVPGNFSSSDFVRQTVGVENVCERAACAQGQTLALSRHARNGVTVALGVRMPRLTFPLRGTNSSQPHRLVCVGLGPGAANTMTYEARAALDAADVIVGYTSYIKLIRANYPSKELLSTPMRREVERCQMALARAAEGATVAMVCSGDPGVYGMAGLLLELAPQYPGVQVEVVPGVTAANAGAAVLGAPLMHDWCSISLSDLMTPWETIERRLTAAAKADFCIALYNPASHKRTDHLQRACDILLAHKDPQTVCGYVRNIGREGQQSQTLTLGELRDAQVDMLTCVFVGNSQTRLVDGRMVTPRGYLQRSS